MGACGTKAAKVADFDAVAPSDAQLTIEIQKNWDHLPKSSSWRPSTRDIPKHIPQPTDRQDHDRHVHRMNQYLKQLKKKPKQLIKAVDKKRSDDHLLDSEEESEATTKATSKASTSVTSTRGVGDEATKTESHQRSLLKRLKWRVPKKKEGHETG